MIIRTPRPITPDTRRNLLVGKITRHAGRTVDTRVTAERFDALSFYPLSRAQIAARLAEAKA